MPRHLLYLTQGCSDMSSMMLMFENERRTSGARPDSLLLHRISPCTLQLARRPLVSMTQSMKSMMSI